MLNFKSILIVTLFLFPLFAQAQTSYERALVIIDMLQYFPAAHHQEINKKIEEQIALAKSHSDLIIFVKYTQDADSSINKNLYGLTSDYQNHTMIVGKNSNSGGEEIFQTLDENGITVNKFILVGVNTCLCVKDTATTLAKIIGERKLEGTNITIPSNACHCHSRGNHNGCTACNVPKGIDSILLGGGQHSACNRNLITLSKMFPSIIKILQQ
ncbi:MAG: isochorismatase family protein [Oligoflexia bacterium]|nr:isochorismatase family protein [Oligoflexia bacterium]MBF0365569.1 isochorismatase family protein [Oligoflexia bacterium]